jgi:hypothetical protein
MTDASNTRTRRDAGDTRKEGDMSRTATKTKQFALLLASDARLAEADQALQRAGLGKHGTRITALRAIVARELQSRQAAVYDEVAAP